MYDFEIHIQEGTQCIKSRGGGGGGGVDDNVQVFIFMFKD